jgi:hypothetical protein
VQETAAMRDRTEDIEVRNEPVAMLRQLVGHRHEQPLELRAARRLDLGMGPVRLLHELPAGEPVAEERAVEMPAGCGAHGIDMPAARHAQRPASRTARESRRLDRDDI